MPDSAPSTAVGSSTANHDKDTERDALIRRRTLLFISLSCATLIYSCLFAYSLFFRTGLLPHYTLQTFTQSGFSISAEGRLSASWNASLHVANPNKKMLIDYNQVVAYVFHKDTCLAESRVPPFHQGKRDERTVDVDIAVVNLYVDEAVLDAIDGGDDEMKLNIKLYADFDIYYGESDRGDKNNKSFLKIWCNDVRITRSSGAMIGGPMNCRVKQYDGPIDAAACSLINS